MSAYMIKVLNNLKTSLFIICLRFYPFSISHTLSNI